MTDRYPIILAHGICRFGLDKLEDDRLHYFRGIRSALMDDGFPVFLSRVSWAGGVERRADELRDELIRITGGFTLYRRVHIIAHSMGGLDARRMIYRHRMQDRVASLSTIGAPHHGSSFADWGMKRLRRLIGFARRIGLDVDGFADLTSESCRRFNEEAAEFERTCGVRYRTYAGVQERGKTHRPLRLSHRIIQREEGPNDGLVSLRSATWRDEYFEERIEADHLNEIGWWDPTDLEITRNLEAFQKRIRDFYLRIARSL
ncbi:MAG: hypothetical protein J7M08_07500 [Planctomycetes bacterium]|nr:hypothetical protein [Planctomycetota bacterium]